MLYLLPPNGCFLLVRNFRGPEGHQDAEDWHEVSSGVARSGPATHLHRTVKIPLLLPPFLAPHPAATWGYPTAWGECVGGGLGGEAPLLSNMDEGGPEEFSPCIKLPSWPRKNCR